jgi:hypothetical protein
MNQRGAIMTQAKALLVGLMLVGSLAFGQGNRVTERAGGFSYVVPRGWTAKAISGYKYQFVFAPVAQKFASNINFVDEAFSGSLQDYVVGNKAAMKKAFKKYQLLAEARASTANAGNAAKLAILNEQNGQVLSQIFYFVEAKTKKFVITCTTLPAQRAALEPQCDALVASFTLL